MAKDQENHAKEKVNQASWPGWLPTPSRLSRLPPEVARRQFPMPVKVSLANSPVGEADFSLIPNWFNF
jgi:hypothetical protein